MNVRSLVAVLGALSLAAPSFAQVDAATAAAIKHEGLENSRVMDTLDRLTNGIGGRLTGSDNFTRACEWARDEFKSFGMTEVQLEKWDTWPITWNRGQWMGRITSPEAMELQVATPAWTNGTKGQVRGVLVTMPESAEDLVANAKDYAGKWLFGRMPSERSPQYKALTRAGTDAGIAGFLESSAGDAANPNRIRVFGTRPYSAEIPDTPPHVVIRRDQAQHIRELLDADQPVVGEFEIRNRWRTEPIDLHNVIAEIRGTEKPDEYVVVSSHLDSWHQATGTTDNGTGSSSTLEAARILMAIGAKPKRTIRFCLWGGEEQGLLGSLKHTTMRQAEMESISAVFNNDTGTNWAHGLTVSTAAEPMMREVIAPVLTMPWPEATEGDGAVFNLRGSSGRGGGGGGSDHASFMRKGVPAFNWSLTGRSDYFSHTWHSQWDTYDEAIPEYMRHTSTVIALTVLGVANLPDKLPREAADAGGTEQRGGGNRGRGGFMGRALGVEFDAADALKISSVTAEGNGAKMGLKVGDRISSIRGTKLSTAEDLSTAMRALFAEQAAGKVEMVVKRGDADVKLEIDPAAFTRRRGGGGESPEATPAAPGSDSGSRRRNADR